MTIIKRRIKPESDCGNYLDEQYFEEDIADNKMGKIKYWTSVILFGLLIAGILIMCAVIVVNKLGG